MGSRQDFLGIPFVKVILMGYIFLFLSVLTNTVKGYCSKRISGDVKNAGNAVTLNLVRNIFVVAVSFAIGFFTVGTSIFELTLTDVIITAAAGVSMALFVIFWTLAVKTDAYMLVSASGSASFVVPAVIGCFLLGETLTYAKISSFALIVVALYFLLRYQVNLGGNISAKSLALLAGVLLSQGINQSMQKLYVFYVGGDASVFTAWSFVFTVISLVVGKLILPHSKPSEDKALIKGNLLYIVLMAAGLFGSSYFQTAAASHMDAIILYPLSSALSLIAGSTMAAVCFKEKIKRDCIIGMIIVFAALILSRADTLFMK